ncbi:MAG: GNAT family N-acetyltransferase [Anaerolineae bacterium]
MLRPLNAEDAPAVLAVYRACEDFLALGPQPEATPGMVADDMAHSAASGGTYRGIWRQGAMIGVVDHLAAGYEDRPDLAYISLLMLVPTARGNGIGAAVVRRLEAEVAADAGVTAIGCSAQVNNPAALRFWQRQGYVVVSGPEAQPDGTTAVHLRKCISPQIRMPLRGTTKHENAFSGQSSQRTQR